MEPMVLLTTLDERYLPQLQVLLTSLSIHNPGEKITLFLLHSGNPEDRLSAVIAAAFALPPDSGQRHPGGSAIRCPAAMRMLRL